METKRISYSVTMSSNPETEERIAELCKREKISGKGYTAIFRWLLDFYFETSKATKRGKK